MCKKFSITYKKPGSFGIDGEEIVEGRGEKKRVITGLLAQGFVVTTSRDTPKSRPKTFRPKTFKLKTQHTLSPQAA